MLQTVLVTWTREQGDNLILHGKHNIREVLGDEIAQYCIGTGGGGGIRDACFTNVPEPIVCLIRDRHSLYTDCFSVDIHPTPPSKNISA